MVGIKREAGGEDALGILPTLRQSVRHAQIMMPDCILWTDRRGLFECGYGLLGVAVFGKQQANAMESLGMAGVAPQDLFAQKAACIQFSSMQILLCDLKRRWRLQIDYSNVRVCVALSNFAFAPVTLIFAPPSPVTFTCTMMFD